MLGGDFKQAAFMGAASEAVKFGGTDGIVQFYTEQPEQSAQKTKVNLARLSAVRQRHDIDLVAGEDLIWVCVLVFHSAATADSTAGSRARSEQVNP